MLHPSQMSFLCRQRPLLKGLRASTRFLPSLAVTRPVHISKKHSSSTCKKQAQTAQDDNLPAHKLSPIQREFWTSRSTWRRAGINTLRCLIGCSIGDFSALWMLQTYFPDLGMGTIMAASSMYIHFALSLFTYLEWTALSHVATALTPNSGLRHHNVHHTGDGPPPSRPW